MQNGNIAKIRLSVNYSPFFLPYFLLWACRKRSVRTQLALSLQGNFFFPSWRHWNAPSSEKMLKDAQLRSPENTTPGQPCSRLLWPCGWLTGLLPCTVCPCGAPSRSWFLSYCPVQNFCLVLTCWSCVGDSEQFCQCLSGPGALPLKPAPPAGSLGPCTLLTI